MLRKLLAITGFLVFFSAAAVAVEVNEAGVHELVAIKGVGPATAERIVEERANGPFVDWQDFITRVKGVGVKTAESMSEAGLTVDAAAYRQD